MNLLVFRKEVRAGLEVETERNGSRNREEWKSPGSKYNQKPKSKGLNYRTAKHN